MNRHYLREQDFEGGDPAADDARYAPRLPPDVDEPDPTPNQSAQQIKVGIAAILIGVPILLALIGGFWYGVIRLAIFVYDLCASLS